MSEEKASRRIVTTVFVALVLDLLAFTLPLPLFPRLIAWYLSRESHNSSALLSRLLALTDSWRTFLISQRWNGGNDAWFRGGDSKKNWDIVLLGGGMGSLFSFCQCVVSPKLGSCAISFSCLIYKLMVVSDKYGRKRILVATMLGNIISAMIWLRSTSFSSFLLSRLVGGLSEGNVQLSTAIISDVTTAATRSKSLALVGIAFSICFTIGPSLGAYFAAQPLPISSASTTGEWNIYATPAAISLGFLVMETVYLIVKLPETRHWKKNGDRPSAVSAERKATAQRDSANERKDRLRKVGWFHCAFLLFFSGAEFTLTFLTYDLFGATNVQNGRLLSYIGVLAAMLQARHVRPALAKKGELQVACTGLFIATLSFYLLSVLSTPLVRESYLFSTIILYTAATGLAYVSATVVTGLTAAAAACCDEDSEAMDEAMKRGRALGGFRSKGQLGRAIGPLLASSVYWLFGPMRCYIFIALPLMFVTMALRSYISDQSRRKKGKTE